MNRRPCLAVSCAVPDGEDYDWIREMVAPPAPKNQTASATAATSSAGFMNYIQQFRNTFSAGSFDQSEDDEGDEGGSDLADAPVSEDAGMMFYDGCVKPAFLNDVACPADCKVNFCVNNTSTQTFAAAIGDCAKQALSDKCGCSYATTESLEELGLPGAGSFGAPPAPYMMAIFESAGKKTDGGSADKVKGEGAMVGSAVYYKLDSVYPQ